MNDLFAYHIPTQTWSHVDAIGNIPSGRAGHSANVWKSSMIVFGGWDGQKTLNDLYSFDFGNLISFLLMLTFKVVINGVKFMQTVKYHRAETPILQLYTKIK